MQPMTPWRKRWLSIEISSLLVLLGSMYSLGQAKAAGGFDNRWLLVPLLASLLVFISFLALMYGRWQTAGSGQIGPLHKGLFAILGVILLGFWGQAAWQVLRQISG